MEVGRKSRGIAETQKEESFRNEAVTKSIKKVLREKKLEGRQDWAAGKSKLKKRKHGQESTAEFLTRSTIN